MTLTNPYLPPASATATLAVERPADPWKAIAWRWERLRVAYNLVIGLAGVVIVVNLPPEERRLDAVVAYGLAANVAYFFGPVGEMYSHWMLDVTQGLIPAGLDRWLRAWALTAAIFGAGTLFSLLLTLAIGLALMFPGAV